MRSKLSKIKKAAILGIAMAFTFSGLAYGQQSPAFKKGDNVINLGVGIGSALGGDGYETSIPPISLSYELGFIDGLMDNKASIGLGAYGAYTANKWEGSILGTSYGWEYTYIIVGARGTFHYLFANKLDSYAGLMLGYNIVSSEFYSDNDSIKSLITSSATASGIGFAGFIGARYYFTESLAALAEVGYGAAYLNLGLAFKF